MPVLMASGRGIEPLLQIAHFLRDRTQGVAGSSPASSIKSSWKWCTFYSAAAAPGRRAGGSQPSVNFALFSIRSGRGTQRAEGAGMPCSCRVRVERGIYRQPNGEYAVCWRHAGRLRFRTVGFDLAAARRARPALIAATHEGKVPVSPRLRFETVAGWWVERFQAKVAAGERHPRTLEAHRYQLDRHLLAAAPAAPRAPRAEDLGERPCDAPERDALRPPVRLDRRRSRRAARARRAPPAAATPPARARSRRDRAPARCLLAARPADGRDRPLHRPAHLRDAQASSGTTSTCRPG
jgi:hypothetical protein